MDGLVAWLKELAVFIVICECILSFAPSGVYKRYVKPFVGLILLLRIASLLFGAIDVDWNERVDMIFDGYEQSVSQYLENVPIMEEEVTKAEEEEFRFEDIYENEKLNDNLISIDRIMISPIEIGEVP